MLASVNIITVLSQLFLNRLLRLFLSPTITTLFLLSQLVFIFTAHTSEAPSQPATPKTPQTTPTMSLPTTPVTPIPAVPITMQPMFPVKTEVEQTPTPPSGRNSSMYEVAAMTQELDTLIITSKVSFYEAINLTSVKESFYRIYKKITFDD